MKDSYQPGRAFLAITADLPGRPAESDYAALLRLHPGRPATRFEPEERAEYELLALYEVQHGPQGRELDGEADILPSLDADALQAVHAALERASDDIDSAFAPVFREEADEERRLRRWLDT
jgi:hypothetical protein